MTSYYETSKIFSFFDSLPLRNFPLFTTHTHTLLEAILYVFHACLLEEREKEEEISIFFSRRVIYLRPGHNNILAAVWVEAAADKFGYKLWVCSTHRESEL